MNLKSFNQIEKFINGNIIRCNYKWARPLSLVGSGYDTFVLPSLQDRHNKTIPFFRVVYFLVFSDTVSLR